jgi:mitochondrial fission protein ELM1
MLRKAPVKPLVWMLMGSRAGDNNQLLALGEALGFPCQPKSISYNELRRLPFLRSGLTIVSRKSRPLIQPPWPDLVIGVGYGSVPVARYIREQSGGRAKLVHIGNPRDKLRDFDLQITTPQYSRGRAPNLLELMFPIGNPAKSIEPTHEEEEWLSHLPSPRRLVAIGGSARNWELDHDALVEAAQKLRGKRPRGSIIAATSARTARSTHSLLSPLFTRPDERIVEHFPRFGTLLRECDEIYVTADSVSMISEAVLSGKPTGLIPIKRSLRGRIVDAVYERPFAKPTFPDFRNFWRVMEEAGLAGTVELPVKSQVCDTVAEAADAVRALVAAGDGVEESKAAGAASNLGADRRPARRQRSGDRARRGNRTAVREPATRV